MENTYVCGREQTGLGPSCPPSFCVMACPGQERSPKCHSQKSQGNGYNSPSNWGPDSSRPHVTHRAGEMTTDLASVRFKCYESKDGKASFAWNHWVRPHG